LDVRERRVPRHVHVARERRLHLRLVRRIQDEIEGKALGEKVLLEPFPDGDDLRVVGHRAEYEGLWIHPNTSMPHTARPMDSYRRSVVGDITVEARASRKILSTPTSLRKATPPHTRMASSVTSDAASPAAALHSRTLSIVSGRAFSIPASVSSSS